MDFLADNNNCGQVILRLVARGNSILAELLRLSNHIPSVFRLESKLDQQKFEDVIIDFSYFKLPEGYDKRIENSQVLLDTDEFIRDTYGNIITRIYSAFESIHRYVTDLQAYIQDVKDSVYFPNTLENIFGDTDGKQLMCEGLFLYGTMLLIADSFFPGIIRERLIVAYQRYFGQKASVDTKIDDVCKLLRSTGFSKSSGFKRPQNYPENFFGRIAVSEDYVKLVVAHLRSDDVYHQVQAYPSPDQRSTALSTQGAMLTICLLFSPTVLNNNTSRMREIVDKFFSDNWVISYYMGNTLNLLDLWEPYKAARNALNNTIEASNVNEKTTFIKSQVTRLIKQSDKMVAEGGLTELKVLDHGAKILSILRDCNVTLQWIILHTAPLSCVGGEQNKKCISIRQQVMSEISFDPSVVFHLLLNSSIVELCVNEIYKKLIEQKNEKWEIYRKAANEEMIELAEVFSGLKPLSKVVKNEKLNKWFRDVAEQVMLLSLDDPPFARRRIIQIIQALKEVKEFHQLDTNVSVIQAVDSVIGNLQSLVKVASVSDDDLVTLALISDLSYAWQLIDKYTPTMQEAIKKDPTQVSKLRAVFLKLSSGLELPLLRINQAKSPDLMSVSTYYSGQLVDYIRKVLQIIPETMFHLLENIISLQTTMTEIPTRLDKEKVRDLAQLNCRFKMAELTQRVATLADGVSMMESTLVGIVKVDPKKLLEEGVRRELVLQVATTLHQGLIFNPKSKNLELRQKLEQVGVQMKGFQRSFEYIQDYINMYGLKLWQEEFSRIVNLNVEQECNQLLRKKISEQESLFQNSAVPIPKFPQTDSQSVNFVGRLLREILRVTNPRTTVYISQMETWYDNKTHREILDSRVMENIEEGLCVAGLVGINRLLAFHIVKELQTINKELEIKLYKDEIMLELYNSVGEILKSLTVTESRQKDFASWVQKTHKLNNSLLEKILKVGHMQILRSLAASRLNSSCKYNSKLLASSLDTFNRALVADVKNHYADTNKQYPDPDGTLMGELSTLLEWCGMSEPLNQIYIIPKAFRHIGSLLFILVISLTNRLNFNKSLGSIVSNKGSEGIDGTPLVIGIASLLRQVHIEQTNEFLALLGKYISSCTLTAASQMSSKLSDLPQEAGCALSIFQEVAINMGIPTDTQTSYLPFFLYTMLYS